jgi:hypothetical protein
MAYESSAALAGSGVIAVYKGPSTVIKKHFIVFNATFKYDGMYCIFRPFSHWMSQGGVTLTLRPVQSVAERNAKVEGGARSKLSLWLAS